MLIDKVTIKRDVANRKSTPKKNKVLKDFFVGDVQIKNVPFIENSSSYTDPYVLSGKTLDRIYSLILENESTGRKSKVIFYK